MTLPALGVADLKPMRGEPRVRDLRLGELLGYGKPVSVRNVIRRNRIELECQGEVVFNLKTTSGEAGGRPETEFYLNETQAVLVCMFSRTPVARQVRAQIAEVFLAYRHGRLVPAAQPKLPKPRAPKNNARWSAMEGRLKQVERALTTHEAIDSARFARTLAILPNILFLDHDDGRQRRQARPRWWGDLEVREAVVATHRQATIDAACALLSARYGDRAPTRSSLARFWLQLDAVFAAS